MSTPEIEVRAHGVPRLGEILNPEALAFLGELHQRFNGRRLALLAARARAAEGVRRRRDAGLPAPRPRRSAKATGRSRRSPPICRPPRRNHRPRRPQDDRQRAQFRRQGVHGRFRGRLLAGVRQHDRGPGQSQRSSGPARSTSPTPAHRQALRRRTEPGGADGAPARLAPQRAASARRRRGDVGLAVRLRPLRLPLRQGAGAPPARRPLSICRRWRATSRRGCGTRCSPSPRRRSASRNGTFKATVLIETLPAAFEMDEILYELRDHIVGLNCGRWDYIFSFIKRLGEEPASS